MAKFKLAGRKKKATAPRGGVPCVILLVSGMILFLMLLYAVMKSFSA